MSGSEGTLVHDHCDAVICWALRDLCDTIVGLTINPYQYGCEPLAHLEWLTDMPDVVGYDYPGCRQLAQSNPAVLS
jgi:hypothetical protein